MITEAAGGNIEKSIKSKLWKMWREKSKCHSWQLNDFFFFPKQSFLIDFKNHLKSFPVAS